MRRLRMGIGIYWLGCTLNSVNTTACAVDAPNKYPTTAEWPWQRCPK